VQTEVDTVVVLIPGPTYRQLFRDETEIQAMTVKAFSSVVFRLMAELEEIHSCTVEQRLANVLLTRASGGGVVAMTQQALANELGTTREVVARSLAEFARRSIVESSRGRIVLLKPKRLVHISAPWRSRAR
jgi:CRP/FNR family transcriptional regulator